jgi:hypothetical protein
VTLSYTVRLICVCLAAFAIVFASIGLLISVSIPFALRIAHKMRAAAAARFILFLRLVPATLSACIVGAVCIPSYIRFEQRAEPEDAGLACLALALLSFSLFSLSLVRAALAWQRSLNPQTALALVGVLRQRIVVSEPVKNNLSAEQLAMALCHEQAHADSRDNLKRLLILLAPGTFPGFSSLERNWKRFAEWAADDRAVAGDPDRSISLAAALVRVARLGLAGEPSPLVTSFLASENDLEARVDRLLNPAPVRDFGAVAAITVSAFAVLIGAVMLHPGTPAGVHDLLERLVH